MIRTLMRVASTCLMVAALVALPGCGGSGSPADKKPAAESGHFEGDGHDHSKDKAEHHEGDGHDHSKEDTKGK